MKTLGLKLGEVAGRIKALGVSTDARALLDVPATRRLPQLLLPRAKDDTGRFMLPNPFAPIPSPTASLPHGEEIGQRHPGRPPMRQVRAREGKGLAQVTEQVRGKVRQNLKPWKLSMESQLASEADAGMGQSQQHNQAASQAAKHSRRRLVNP